jgi:hypothetical protein
MNTQVTEALETEEETPRPWSAAWHLLWIVPVALWVLCGVSALVFDLAVRHECHWAAPANASRNCGVIHNRTVCVLAMAKRTTADAVPPPLCDTYWDVIVVLGKCFLYPLVALVVIALGVGSVCRCFV